ncbi:hypothetical protein N7532_004732 [Penicillium argentinense]|uniref:Uncharacterized protein n=1 Tax=Penicillium argentinense TaxID=1131581 RepID=A0A9W9KFX7_9EURO|nr:uncharacterized protein N7532_004732 [Penicillium argentinense]KAJ5104203.1 hypothetical protein N7532_004732 [Penicillium argentinense]
MTISSIETQAWKCQQCGLPGVRLPVRPNDATSGAYYKCVPCNRNLGFCPCVTPGSRTTSTCPCSTNSGRDSPGLEDQLPRGVAVLSMDRKQSFNPHNPDSGFDEDWEANCKPGFMVSRFPAVGDNLLW